MRGSVCMYVCVCEGEKGTSLRRMNYLWDRSLN